MKLFTRIVAILVLLTFLVTMTGCYGSFTLVKKVYQFNGSFGNKFLNSAVMWVFMWLPIYEGAGFIDVVVLNTIEFWTGSNPLAMAPGDQKVRFASNDGKDYQITMTQNNIRITEVKGPDQGKSVLVTYSPKTHNWTMNDGNQTVTIAKVNGKMMNMMYPDGKTFNVDLQKSF